MLDELLNDGWDHHDKDSATLAARLEAAAREPIPEAKLAPFLHLAVHTLGEHVGDWTRAASIAELATAQHSPTSTTYTAWLRLSLAKLMAGDTPAALAAELQAVSAAPNPLGALIESRFQLVSALTGVHRAAEAAPLYAAALNLADAAGENAPHRAIAVASNNLASELVEQETRSEAEATLMVDAADAAHVAWLKAGTWQHEERALYLKALVANAVGKPADALTYAETALTVIADNGQAPVDAAFLNLARAKAHALQNNRDARTASLAVADALAAGFKDDAGLTSWYAGERAKLAPAPGAL